MRTGSAWNRVAAYWSGQVEDRICQLCLEGEENANHFWKCKSLEQVRKDADKDIAALDPDDLPNPIKQGIAPALGASSCGTFWGDCQRKPGTSDAMGDARRRRTKEGTPSDQGQIGGTRPKDQGERSDAGPAATQGMPGNPKPGLDRGRPTRKAKRI